MHNGAKIFNVIRANSSDVYMNTIPSATNDNINELKNILFNDSYEPQLNEFVNNLVNRIALTVIRNRSFSNPLAMFKKGSIALGTDIQEIYENPAEAEQYELSNTGMAKLLSITNPDTHVAYHQLNRKDMYTKTISRENLAHAFVSWDKFEEYVNSITNSLYSGNYIDEFKYTKKLIDGAYNQGKLIVKQVSAVADQSTSKAILKAIKADYVKMAFPSKNYNCYTKFSGAKGEVTTWTDKSRVVLIVTADVMATLDIEELAQAFNLSKAEFEGRVIVIDSFENDEIQAVLCDEAFLQIYENVLRFDSFYNARTMTWNYYLHAWGTFSISPFANVMVYATEVPVPVEEIDLGNDISDLEEEETKTLTVTLDPNDTTTDITYVSGDETIMTVEKASNTSVKITGVKKGETTLTAIGENGITDSIDVTVIEATD